jgi:MFS family permease
MRIKIEESAVFVNAISRKAPAAVPFLELLQTNWKPLVIVLLAAAAESASGFFFLVYGFSYAVAQLKIPASILLQSLLIGNTIGLMMAPVFGALSDRIGRRLTLSAAYIFAAVYTPVAFFPMLESGNTVLIYLAMIIPVSIVSPLSIGVIASFYSEQFSDARLRYSGVGVGRGLGTTLGGGLMPVIAASLMAVVGRAGPITWFAIVCIAGTIAILIARETKDEKLA